MPSTSRARQLRRFVASAAARRSTREGRSILYVTVSAADFLDYVNPPIGKGTAGARAAEAAVRDSDDGGTGSETTGVTIFDLTKMHAKTGIANRRLKPTLGMLDPDNTRTDAAGSRGVERPRHPQPRDRIVHRRCRSPAGRCPDSPKMRPAYQGSNPISDVWSMQALRWWRITCESGGRSVRR
jgi:hydroxyacid-oxoacid transhydrogenase